MDLSGSSRERLEGIGMQKAYPRRRRFVIGTAFRSLTRAGFLFSIEQVTKIDLISGQKDSDYLSYYFIY